MAELLQKTAKYMNDKEILAISKLSATPAPNNPT